MTKPTAILSVSLFILFLNITSAHFKRDEVRSLPSEQARSSKYCNPPEAHPPTGRALERKLKVDKNLCKDSHENQQDNFSSQSKETDTYRQGDGIPSQPVLVPSEISKPPTKIDLESIKTFQMRNRERFGDKLAPDNAEMRSIDGNQLKAGVMLGGTRNLRTIRDRLFKCT